MFAQVSTAIVIGIMLLDRANGVCGNGDEINVCKPRHECNVTVVGTCQSFWCCKSETYSENNPPGILFKLVHILLISCNIRIKYDTDTKSCLPKTSTGSDAGECICVSDFKYCEMVPFPYQHHGGDCVCCDCTEQCAPLQSYNSSVKTCPNFERPIGDCHNNQSNYCCPSDEPDDLCKCSEVCTTTWKIVGSCGKSCLNEAKVNGQVVTKPRTLELLCGIYFTLLLTSYLIK